MKTLGCVLGCARLKFSLKTIKLLQFEKKPKTSLEFRILTRFVITLVISTPVLLSDSILIRSILAHKLIWLRSKVSSLFGCFSCFTLVEIAKNRLTVFTNQKRLLCLAYKLIRFLFFLTKLSWRVQSPISSEYCFLHTNWSDFEQRSHALPFLLKGKH